MIPSVPSLPIAVNRFPASIFPTMKNSVHTLPLGAMPFTMDTRGLAGSFSRPADPNAILDALSEETFARDEFMPYWADLWPSTEGMLAVLDERFTPDWLAHSTCEIGCGLGIIAAALSGRGVPIVATDYAGDALGYVRYNMNAAGGKPMVAGADWRHPPFKKAFDRIIGSDILYERRWIDPVAAFISSMLVAGGEALIADPRRTHWNDFKEALPGHGLRLAECITREANAGKSRIEVAVIVHVAPG